MSDQTTSTLTARLIPQADTAALLRVVSILHSRCAAVRHLVFDAEDERGATVTARVTLGNTGWATLRDSLRRPMEVLEVETESARETPQPPFDDGQPVLAGRTTKSLRTPFTGRPQWGGAVGR